MSRVLKFRAWTRAGEWNDDGNSQKFIMINSDDLAFEEYMPLVDQLAETEDFKPMQFTGLLDCNGVEVFEGDVLKTPYYTCLPEEYGVEDDEGFYIGAVGFVPSKGFCIPKCFKYSDVEEEDKLIKTCRYFQIRSEGCKVIGNIHENKNLLEKDK